MKRLIIVVFIIISRIGLAEAQAEMFAPGVISNGKVFGPTFTEDGNRVFFVNSRGGRDSLTLMTSVRKNGSWSQPKPLTFSSRPGVWKDIDPFISPDQKLFIFNTNRSAHSDSVGSMDVWAAPLKNGKVGKPYRLDKEINSSAPEYFATASRNGNLYFTSIRPEDNGVANIYRSEFKNGKYQQAVLLPAPLNSEYYEGNPFISPDEDFIIFAREGDEDSYGDSDLYISFRKSTGWTVPSNLGPQVNTKDAEFCPYYDSKSGVLYFGRIVRGSPLVENIYYVKLAVEDFKQKE
jgi:hypothetical protein